MKHWGKCRSTFNRPRSATLSGHDCRSLSPRAPARAGITPAAECYAWQSLGGRSPVLAAIDRHEEMESARGKFQLWLRLLQSSVKLHSNRGCQFTSLEWRDFVCEHNLGSSMSLEPWPPQPSDRGLLPAPSANAFTARCEGDVDGRFTSARTNSAPSEMRAPRESTLR